MNKLLIIVLLGLGLALFPSRGTGQTNATKAPPGNYYSWQHPEWPPAPGKADDKLRSYRLDQTNLPANSFLVDDRGVVYPKPAPPKPAPTVATLIWPPEDELARYPELVNQLKFEHAKRESAAQATLRLEDADEASLYGDIVLRLEAASKRVQSAPYTFNERSHMEKMVLLSEIAKTNQGIIRAGVYWKSPNGMSQGYYQGDPNQVLRLGELAREAIASTNPEPAARFRKEWEGK